MAYELTAVIAVGSAPPGTAALPQGAWLLSLMDGPPHAARELSRGRVVPYRDGAESTRFVSGYGAVNDGLALLGITAESPMDAFDTLGLGRYRHIRYCHSEDGLRAIAPRPSP